MESQTTTGKSRAELLEEYKKKKILANSTNGNINQNTGVGKSSLGKQVLQKKIRANDGNLQLEHNITKLVKSEKKNSNFNQSSGKYNQEIPAGSPKSTNSLAKSFAGRQQHGNQKQSTPISGTIEQASNQIDNSILKSAQSHQSESMMIENDLFDEVHQESFQESVHLKMELEAKNTLVYELRDENIKLLEELKNVQNQLLDLKDQNLEFNRLDDQVSEKNALIDELNLFIIQLKSQLQELSSRPSQYADMWIQAAAQDEQDSIANKKLQDELEEVQITKNELLNELSNKNNEIESLKSRMQEMTSDKEQEKAKLNEKYDSLYQNYMELEKTCEYHSEMAKKLQIELDESLDCVEKLDKSLDVSQDKVLGLEKELCSMEEQYTSLSTLSESWKIENDKLAKALQDALSENKELHETIHTQQETMSSLQNDVNCLLEASSLLETQNGILEKELSEKNKQLEILECDIYRLEQNVVSDEIIKDTDLIQGLSEALEQNKDLHEAVQKLESIIAQQSEQLMMKGVANMNIEQTDSINPVKSDICVQTDMLDLDYVLKEFSSTLRALKLADLSSNVMHQKNLSQYEYFQNQLQNLSQENIELQNIVAERQDLEKRLIKGLHAATSKANDLEAELMSLKKSS